MTRMVIHIGAGKCGSSAIQHYLHTNATALREFGALVPDEEFSTERLPAGQQISFFETLRQMNVIEARTLWRDKCRHLLAVAREEAIETVVVSAENLINPTGTAMLLHGIDADVEIVVYVRRQLDYLVSAWQQWYLKTHAGVENFLDQHLGVIANWNLCLADWESSFGRDNIQVRRYGRGLLYGGDVVADFLHASRLKTGLASNEAPRVNTSYSDAITAIAMRCPEQFTSMHDNDFYVALASLVGDSARRGRPTTFPFSAAEVDAIEQVYAPGNEALVQKYFPDLGGPLFDSAASDGIAPIEAQEVDMMTNDLLDRAIREISTAVDFRYAPPAEFALLLESLRTTG
jgi:hypothetical protein